MKKITKSVVSFVLSCLIAVAASGCTTPNDRFNKVNAYTEFIDSSVTELISAQPKAAAQEYTTASIKAGKKQTTKIFRCLAYLNMLERRMRL